MSSSVLVVDDSPAIGRMVVQVLERAGYRARWACDDTQALAAAEEQAPDVVIVDLRLGGSDGLALARKLRRSCTRIIGLSGDPPPASASRTLHAFLLKPVSFADLLAAVRG